MHARVTRSTGVYENIWKSSKTYENLCRTDAHTGDKVHRVYENICFFFFLKTNENLCRAGAHTGDKVHRVDENI